MRTRSSSLLDDATGGYGEAYKLMAVDYVSFFDDLVSSMLKLPLGLALHQYTELQDDFMNSDLIYATISQRTARELLKKSSKERHRGLESELSVTDGPVARSRPKTGLAVVCMRAWRAACLLDRGYRRGRRQCLQLHG